MKRISRSCQILTPCYLITQISPNREKRAKSPSEPLKNSRLPDWEMDMVDSITLLQGSSWEFLTWSHQSWHPQQTRINYQGCHKHKIVWMVPVGSFSAGSYLSAHRRQMTRPACEASKGSQWKRRGFSPLLATPVSNDKLNVSSHWGCTLSRSGIFGMIYLIVHI